MSGLRFNFMIVVLVVGLLFLQYRLWFRAGGIHDMLRLKQQVALQAEETAALKKQNDLLLFQVARLRNDKGQAEERARNELGMIKKDEKFYQIVK